VCQIQDKAEKSSPQANSSKVVPDDVLTTATLVLEDCFTQLFESISTTNCDILSLKSTLYKSSPQAYKIMSQNLTTVTPTYTINLKSSA
jgi:hypothetical protein